MWSTAWIRIAAQSVSCRNTRSFRRTPWPKALTGGRFYLPSMDGPCAAEGRGAPKRNVHASVKMGVTASYPPFIFTSVHFFLSAFFFFILPRDDDWQINICLTTCLRNQKEGAVRITCQKMRLGAVVICWGLQSFRDKVSFNEAKKPPLKKKKRELGRGRGEGVMILFSGVSQVFYHLTWSWGTW